MPHAAFIVATSIKGSAITRAVRLQHGQEESGSLEPLVYEFERHAVIQETLEERRSNVAERMVEANGVELCTEAFGVPADRTILLVMGMIAIARGLVPADLRVGAAERLPLGEDSFDVVTGCNAFQFAAVTALRPEPRVRGTGPSRGFPDHLSGRSRATVSSTSPC